MRVAYVCADPGVPVFGRKGCSIHVQEVVRALAMHGARVDLFAARVDGPAPPGLEHVALHAIPRLAAPDAAARERAALRANRRFRDALESVGPFEVVYERYSLWSFAAMRFARAAGIPGMLEVNAPLIEEQAEHRTLCHRSTATRIAQRTFATASIIIAVSKGVADYVQRFPGAERGVAVIPNGVNPARFSPVESRQSRDPGLFSLGFVGTLKPWHGLSVLIEAFAQLHAEDPGMRLIVVGDGPWRTHLEDGLSAHGLSAASRVTGAVAPQCVPSLLASMDAAVAPYTATSNFYFSPLKVLEYMAAGLPIVASRLGQIPDLVTDGVTGLLCEPDDPGALADRVRLLRDNPVFRGQLGAAARTAAARHHTWARVTRRIFALAGLTLPVPRGTTRPANALMETRC